jgi:hypothetical protein
MLHSQISGTGDGEHHSRRRRQRILTCRESSCLAHLKYTSDVFCRVENCAQLDQNVSAILIEAFAVWHRSNFYRSNTRPSRRAGPEPGPRRLVGSDPNIKQSYNSIKVITPTVSF